LLPAVTAALVGDDETVKSAPVPVIEADCMLPLTESSVTVSVPVRVPVAVGENVMLTVQLVLGAKVEVQVFV
jgi:hypothetical protein